MEQAHDVTREDFATMVLQERCMYMFNNNLQASDGQGPSQADRESKLRAQQEREADEFMSILYDDYTIILEAIQSKNPEYHLPKAAENTGQKSTKATLLNSQKKETTKRSQNQQKQKNKNDDNTTSPAPVQAEAEVPAFKQKLAVASNVIKGCVNPKQNSQNKQVPNNLKDYAPRNPPVVVITDGTNMSRCKGCGKKITPA